MEKKKNKSICIEVTLKVTKYLIVKVAEFLIKKLWGYLDDILF